MSSDPNNTNLVIWKGYVRMVRPIGFAPGWVELPSEHPPAPPYPRPVWERVWTGECEHGSA